MHNQRLRAMVIGPLLTTIVALWCSANATEKLMSSQAHRYEFKQLYRDDVPYAVHIRALADHAEARWPQLSDDEREIWDRHVYRYLNDALRDEIPTQWPAERTIGSRQRAARYIAEAFKFRHVDLPEQEAAFYREVFEEDWFQNSTSAYHDAVIDLWQRFEKAGRDIPASNLLGLNQPLMGRPGGQRSFTFESGIGDLYSELGEHKTAALWYENAGAGQLGPLKAADAYFLARKYDDSERCYRFVLSKLDDWVAKKPMLLRTPALEPLEEMDREATQRHITARLSQIEQMQASPPGLTNPPATTRAATQPATQPVTREVADPD